MLGPGRSLWVVVVGTRHVFVVLVYHSWALNLPWSFLSRHDVAANGQGRDIKGANHQPPVGSRRWWCCVSGVGGNRCGGVAYLSTIKRNDDVVIVVVPRRSVLHGCDMAWLTCGVVCGSGAVECVFRGCWSLSAGCRPGCHRSVAGVVCSGGG